MADDSSVPHRPTYMLTTFDNPFDPFSEWDEWYMWDMRAGYHTPGLLDRVARISEDLSEADEFLAIQQAIDEIVRENVSGMHRKLQRGQFETLVAERNRVATIAERDAAKAEDVNQM